jgi:hypothetical protein
MGRPPPTRPAIFTSSYITVCLPLWYTSDRLFFRAIISLCFTAPATNIHQKKVTARNFEQLAAPWQTLVRSRVAELSERVMAALAKMEIAHPVAERWWNRYVNS